jgi:hypothetical protein
MLLGLAKSDPKHFKKELGLAEQQDLIFLGLAEQSHLRILLFVL